MIKSIKMWFFWNYIKKIYREFGGKFRVVSYKNGYIVQQYCETKLLSVWGGTTSEWYQVLDIGTGGSVFDTTKEAEDFIHNKRYDNIKEFIYLEWCCV